jgi:hypothetical protein
MSDRPPRPTPADDLTPLLSRSACREQALAFRQTLNELDPATITSNDLPSVQVALLAAIAYSVMALDQDRPA